MNQSKPALSLIEWRSDAPVRIAMSLVHRFDRIDIPVRDVLKIEAIAEQTFFFSDTQTSKTYHLPYIEVALKAYIRARIYRLTSRIVGETIDIVVASEVISSPVVQAALGIQESFEISVWDMEHASDLAAKLRKGWVMPRLRVV